MRSIYSPLYPYHQKLNLVTRVTSTPKSYTWLIMNAAPHNSKAYKINISIKTPSGSISSKWWPSLIRFISNAFVRNFLYQPYIMHTSHSYIFEQSVRCKNYPKILMGCSSRTSAKPTCSPRITGLGGPPLVTDHKIKYANFNISIFAYENSLL